MIKNPEQMNKVFIERARGGEGVLEALHLFNPDETKSKYLKFLAKVTLKPGCSVGVHPHDNDEEIYYILKGTATLYDNGEKKELLPGMAVVTSGGAAHGLENNGEEALEYLAIIMDC